MQPPALKLATGSEGTQVLDGSSGEGVFLYAEGLDHTPTSAVVAPAKTMTLIFGEMPRGEQSFGAAGFSGSQVRVVELFVGWEAPGVNRSWHENTDLVRSTVCVGGGFGEVAHAGFTGTDKGYKRTWALRGFEVEKRAGKEREGFWRRPAAAVKGSERSMNLK